jgi:hypothetical protein
MSLSILENVEIIDITLICLENVENDFICCKNCRKYLYLFKTKTRDVYYCCRRGEDGNGGGDLKGKNTNTTPDPKKMSIRKRHASIYARKNYRCHCKK